MIPDKVLDVAFEQLRPIIHELAKYNADKNESILMEFDVGMVRFEFKK